MENNNVLAQMRAMLADVPCAMLAGIVQKSLETGGEDAKVVYALALAEVNRRDRAGR